jgi:hypothetical protein
MNRLHSWIGVVVLAARLAPAPLIAQTKDPLIGTWILDRARSTFNGTLPLYGGTPPGTRVMTFEHVANGIRHVTETRDRDNMGDVYRMAYTFRIDGAPYPSDPQMPVGDVSFRRIDAQTIERTGRYQGRVVETVVYRVSADGRTLTATAHATNHDAAGNEVDASSVQIFVKQ